MKPTPTIMLRNPSFYLFLCAILLVFVTFHIPFAAKGIFIWGVGLVGSGLSFWSLRTSSTLAQKFFSVFLGISFIAFALLLCEGFKVWE